ncbi:MAG TPA: DUF3089 domain-containing protein [Acidimicrobiales bacterium]|nr:DUF3089 domain-containing protein [Acidimicrobiales bacterium]
MRRPFRRRGPGRSAWRVAAAGAASCGASALALAALVAAPAGAATRGTTAHHAGTLGTSSHHSPRTVWLCRPGLAHDPCVGKRTLTSVAADGTRTTETAAAPTPSGVDCFYVYPTVSSETSDNANLVVQPAERIAAVVQASPFSQLCSVWAPMYRQTTLGDIVKDGIAGLPRRAVSTAYRSLLSGWHDFLAHDDDGRPIVLIGHSQGAALLVRLIHKAIDVEPGVRSRILVAILAGGNLQVPSGRTVGATFRHVPLCTKTGETGCAIAWSSFPSAPPAASPFGRPGEGVSIQAGERASNGEEVACTNPAALGGGTAGLDPYFAAAQVPTLSPAPSTPWVTFPGLYTAHCAHAGGATWLQIDHASGTGRPVVAETQGPAFGYHADDVNLVLGNLLGDVAAAESAFRAHH